MSMEYIRTRYGVPAKRGARVRYTDSPDSTYDGTIVGSRGAHLRIRFDGKPMGAAIVDAHPTWKLEYLKAEPPRVVQATRIESAIRLLYPGEMTPTARNVLLRILEEETYGLTCPSECAAQHPGREHNDIRSASVTLRCAAGALEIHPPLLRAQYVALLRLYADEPWRLP